MRVIKERMRPMYQVKELTLNVLIMELDPSL